MKDEVRYFSYFTLTGRHIIMPTEVEQQEIAEQELQNQNRQKIEVLKGEIGEKLDKFANELFAHLKSTGQTRRPSASQLPAEKSVGGKN